MKMNEKTLDALEDSIKKWEYRACVEPVTDLPMSEGWLNTWGDEGWELAACFTEGLVRRHIFKRPMKSRGVTRKG